MKRISVFLADAEQRHIDRTRSAIERCKALKYVGSANNGEDALRMLTAMRADVVLLDIQLPGMDGMSLMQALKKTEHAPLCIVCTRFYSEICVELARRAGASYILYKPLDYDRLSDVILNCCREYRTVARPSSASPAERGVQSQMTELGFPSNLSGCQYLQDAMLRLFEDRTLLNNLTKGLYTNIANGRGATATGVERAIRNAITIAFERGSLSHFFPSRPTNREFFEYALRDYDLRG